MIARDLFVVSDIHGHYDELISSLDSAGFDENNENHFITYDEYCEQLRETHWECIQISMGSCNEMKGELSISNYPNLKTFVIDQDALTNLTSLIVSNNPQLTQFETWYWANEDSASLKFVENLVIESM